MICGFLLYGNTLGHDFALDDAIVIQDNQFTKKGFQGIWDQLTNDQFVGFYGVKKELVSGGRYRPLSMVMFNIEYALFGESPWIFHLINVILYILSGFTLYLVLSKLLNSSAKNSWISLALLASLIWFFHPIHTEVVANIKGRDEIIAFLLELISLFALLKYIGKQEKQWLLWMSIAYFLALLAKESAITWLAIFPLTIYFFRKAAIRQAILPIFLSMAVALIWLYIRYLVVGGGIENVADNLMNDPFLEAGTSDKYATITYTLGKYLQLLVFPHPLTYDYYPKHIPILSWRDPLVLLSLISYLFLIYFALQGLIKRKLYGFAILFFFITLSIASNLLFPIGAFMNERFIYVSSLGFSLMAAQFFLVALPKLSENSPKSVSWIKGLVAFVLLLYAIKTIDRNMVWKNNLTLSVNDANISVNGAKSNVMAGGLLSEEAAKENDPQKRIELLKESEFYLERALNVYPDYIDALILMGNVQWELKKDLAAALPYYQRILNINNQHRQSWENIFIVLEADQDVDQRIAAYQRLLSYNHRQADIYLYLGRAFGREKGELQKSIQFMEKGLEFAPDHFELLSNLGTAYGLQKNYMKAIEVLERARSIRPNVAKVHSDLGLSYYFSGQIEKAKASFNKAIALDPSIDRNQFPV
jgi:tetratricopeptide (TPR) repeat protein